jgi:hypothetical protein
MKDRHRYEVEASRRVRSPAYGPEAYFIDYTRQSFAFGKGKPFATGPEAFAAAAAHAEQLRPMSSRIYIIKWNGYAGHSEVFKDSEEMFSGRWDSLRTSLAALGEQGK